MLRFMSTVIVPSLFKALFVVVVFAGSSLIGSGLTFAHDDATQEDASMSSSSDMMMDNHMMPEMNADRGRNLFVEKGCVACHAINGVGGHDAMALDAHTMRPMMNPFDFAAKMWAMAPVMIAAQEEAFGEQVLFSGDELADIIAFVHNDEVQHHFTDSDLTPLALEMMHHEHGTGETPMDAHGEDIGHMHGNTDSHGDTGHEEDGHTN